MSESKSIILSNACILISFLILITTMTAVVAINDISFRKQIINDLPKEPDIHFYLAGLEKVVDFCLRHKIYVDEDMEFGLFMVDVNLRELFQQKRMSFSKNIRFHLEQLLVKSNTLTKFFLKMAHTQEDDKKLEGETKYVLQFFNKTTWSRPGKFNQDLLEQTKVYSPEMLEQMYGRWDNYVIFTLDKTKNVPTSAEFDACAAQLVLNPEHGPNIPEICEVSCEEALDEGSDYGYGLLHRTLLMVIARFSRGCVIESRIKDKFKTDKFCMMSFNEAEYIAFNRFDLPDLMFEQISLCGFLGHAQFLRNYWLKSLLQYQTKEGCFTQKLATGEFNEKRLREGEEDTWGLFNPPSIMNGQCDGHFTAVAAGALSQALRYIIETYY